MTNEEPPDGNRARPRPRWRPGWREWTLVAVPLSLAGIVLGTGMDLVFEPFQVILLGLATAVVAMITQDGETHWFEGVQLLAVYAMIAVAVFFI